MGGLGTLFLLGVIGWAVWARRPGASDPIDDVLIDAARAGIITDDQRVRILERAKTRAPSGGFSGARWLAILAGLFVLAGVSLLIATNWDRIGPLVRIGAFLTLLGLVGEAAVRSRDRGTILATSLELVWFVLPLLGIGLYGQTFQLSGDPTTPFLVWLALTLPIAWWSDHLVVRTLHVAALVAVLFSGSFLSDGALSLHGHPPLSAWLLSIGTLAAATFESHRLLPLGQRHHVVGVIAGWILGVLLAPRVFGLEDFGWFAVALVALTTLWLTTLTWLEAGTAEIAPAANVWLGAVYAATFLWDVSEPLGGSIQPAGRGLVLLLLAAALAAATLVPIRRFASGAPWSSVARLLLLFPVVGCPFLLLDEPFAMHAVALAANVLLVATAIALLWHGSVSREVAQINYGILILLVLLVTRFLDVLGTFVQSGIGFIVAGILLAALAWGLERTRRRLIDAPDDDGAGERSP